MLNEEQSSYAEVNTALLLNFKVDKSASTVFVDKEFDADLSLVWDAFTKQEILDQWWAPQPLISKTHYMDFRVGGKRFYAMVNPDGAEILWQIFEYTSITAKSNFKFLSLFTDKDETPLLPGTNWDLSFREQHTRLPHGQKITKVSISIYFDSLKELERWTEVGFKEGFTATLNELTNLLRPLKNRK